MNKKTNTRKKYTPNKILQLIGFNPNIKDFKNQKSNHQNLITNSHQPKNKYNNKTKIITKIEIENKSKKNLNLNNKDYNNVNNKYCYSKEKNEYKDIKNKKFEEGESVVYNSDNSNSEQKADIQKNIIKNNRIDRISINIKSNQHSNKTAYKEKKNIKELEEMNLNYKTNKNNNINKTGLPNKTYFIEKYQQNIGNIYNIQDFILQDVKPDGNCGYRCISLQIYGEEDKYYIIRENVYKYLTINKNNYKNIPIELDGKLINAIEYIEKVKNNKFWMGDLEISVIHKIFNAVLFLFEINYNNELILLQINGDINNNISIILTLCFINNNHYNIIYENTKKLNN